MSKCSGPVVPEVTLDEVTGGEGRHEGKLPGEDSRADDPRELIGVLSRFVGVGPLDPEHGEAGALGRQSRATPDGPNLDARHRARHVEVVAVRAPWLHQRHAVAATDVLGRILQQPRRIHLIFLPRSLDLGPSIRRAALATALTRQ
jgi:hypothetical protein